MRIGLEKERSERVSSSTSQVCPCGLSRSGTGYTATSSVCLIPVGTKPKLCRARGPRKCRDVLSQKGGDPAAGSHTRTLLRLPPNHEPYLGRLPPCGWLTGF